LSDRKRVSFVDEVVTPVVSAAATTTLVPKEASKLVIEDAEDRMHERSLGIIEGLLGFVDLSREELISNEPPERWVLEHGVEEAERMFRLALLGNTPKNDAPVGVTVATKMAEAAIKARATREGGARTLNVQTLHMPQVASLYPTREVVDVDE